MMITIVLKCQSYTDRSSQVQRGEFITGTRPLLKRNNEDKEKSTTGIPERMF